MNAGTKSVEWLFRDQLMVDDEWSERTPSGFRWWADQNAQTVEVVGHEAGPDGEPSYLVSVRTEMLRSFDVANAEAAALNALVMPFASMAGPVYDLESRTLSLCSLVRVHDSISGWMNPVIGTAAVLQVDEARRTGPGLAVALGAEEALSGPPGRGLRPEPDEMTGVVEALIAPLGRQPSRWLAGEFEEAVDGHMQGPPALLATSGGAGFTAEFPYGDGSSLCQAMAGQPHPRLGNGLFLLQSFPYTAESDAAGARLALSMNGEELAERPFGYGFGSYSFRDNILYFSSFFPNALYRPGLLPNVYYSCAQRAREASSRLTENDWTRTDFAPTRGAAGRIVDRLGGR